MCLQVVHGVLERAGRRLSHGVARTADLGHLYERERCRYIDISIYIYIYMYKCISV